MEASQATDVRLYTPAEAKARASRAQAREMREFLKALAFLAPSLIIFAVFVFYPLFKSIYLSTYATDAIGRPKLFVGLENYTDLLQNEDIRNSFVVSLKFAALTVPSILVVATLLATLANVRLRGIAFFRTLFGSTIAISVAVASTIFLLMYSPTAGVLNYFLGLVGIPPIQWLVRPESALPAVSITTVWSAIGFNFIVILAGMQAIPDELYESARIDGADGFRLWRHITLPLLSPTLFFVIVVSTLGVLQAFAQIHILTRGGPGTSTNAIVYLIYRDAFLNFKSGVASAEAMMLFVVMLALTILQFRVLEARVHYS